MTSVSRDVFGILPGGGGTVERFHLESEHLKADIISYGCIITRLETKDKHGNFTDIVLGFDDLEGYVNKHPYFGAVIGRVANRIANGKFTVDGKDYELAINNGPNSIHGGIKGFDKVLWTPEMVENGVCFFHTSADGDEGYPGELKVWVTYTVDGSKLTVNYRAQSTKVTPINLTNHSYFNLAGQGSSDIYGHEVSIDADHYLPVDDTMIPTGEVASVVGTCFDLRKPVMLESRIEKFQINGFDHNFCLRVEKEPQHCARVHHPSSGRVLSVSTTQPGVQFYTANFLDGSLKGKGGAVYQKHSAFCLETQAWPDAVNKPQFPSALLYPGEEYNHTTWFEFA
ncbi:galactose mutarotase [Spea bombifrons]|uniref:galactose mutarotase n=1 Tax=Spea bombifrons TaxID=233779 RepID=UPI00234B1F72|nr:galactose mutarotase [Spea bombifrons]XP_053315439.1 galactose mutarotase [Spea bombifrons]XP_053315440.1 galactose mutarotase [Spea bombifrons]